MKFISTFFLCLGLITRVFAADLTGITATPTELIITGHSAKDAIGIAELQPYQSTSDLAAAPSVARHDAARDFKIHLPRFDGPRDRLYSGFLAFTTNGSSRIAQGEIHFVDDLHGVAKYTDPFPRTASKKGLQVQMIDDAIALGVKHAGLNLNLGGMVDLDARADSFSWESDGVTYHFHRGVIEDLDRRVKPLSDARMVVTLILLAYKGNPAVDKILINPHCATNAPNHLGAFNTTDADGLRWFKACIEFLADRYSQPPFAHGRAVNFIVGNEVNSHWYWANLGEATMQQFADDYLRTVRVCNTAVHKYSACGRVYISLEHHWTIRYDTPLKSFGAREFIDYFNDRAHAQGDFDWNLAFHPYPEDLTEPRTWNDKTALPSFDTPRITFKNISVLPLYFQRPELLYRHEQRHIILSEQGFNTPAKPDGELWQAAGFCYAYYKIARTRGIDAFILHRHVDHRDEGGLNLGLWRRDQSSNSASEPATKKPIYFAFLAADTPEWRKAFEFALPVIGINRWEDLDASIKHPLKK